MIKILLINPATPGKYIHKNRGGIDKLLGPLLQIGLKGKFKFSKGEICSILPPITLIGLKNLFECMKNVDVNMVDEQVQPINFNLTYDIICITATTLQIKRAKEISRIFKKRGVTTVIGGMHSTAMPQDCINDFDVICQGEAENYIERMIHDYKNNKLNKIYKCDKVLPLDSLPFYDYGIGDGPYLPVHVISFSRGCNFKCEFCSIGGSFSKYRTRTIRSVIEEIKRVGAKTLWFPDATITASLETAKELLDQLKKLDIKWISQATANIEKHDWLLDLMADSGCLSVSIGFESLDNKNLLKSKKYQNKVENYVSLINKLHARGIAIEGNFMFGFDDDTIDIFDETTKFIIDNKIDLPQIFVLTPYPGTKLFYRLESEKRIVDKDWSHYDNMHFRYLPVYVPLNMSREELRDGCIRTETSVFNFKNTIKRLSSSKFTNIPINIGNYVMMSRIYKEGYSDVDILV